MFDNKQPKPDLAVPLSSVVACRESFLGKEQLLLLSLRSGEQLRFCSENFSALWSGFARGFAALKTQQDPEQTARQQQVKANGQAIAAEQEQKGEKTKRYTPSMQQRAEQAAVCGKKLPVRRRRNGPAAKTAAAPCADTAPGF